MVISLTSSSHLDILKKISKDLPLKDGRIDYTHAKTAVVVTIFLQYGEKILLLKRSTKVGTYREHWATITGYLDEFVSIEKKAHQEIQEELSIAKRSYTLRIGKHYSFTHNKRKWIVFPMLAAFTKKPRIKLDWEHTDYLWIDPKDLKTFETLPKLEKSYAQTQKLA